MYIRTYVFVSFETTPVIRIQILIDPTFNSSIGKKSDRLIVTVCYFEEIVSALTLKSFCFIFFLVDAKHTFLVLTLLASLKPIAVF